MIMRSELVQRQAALNTWLVKKKLAAAIFFDPVNIQYFTNFIHLSTERPVVLVIPVDCLPLILLPKLEHEHFELQSPWFSNIYVYSEYPGEQHPMLILKKILMDQHLTELPIGMDYDGFILQCGYQGPPLSSLVEGELVNIHQFINHLRMLKSNEEIQHLRESGSWASKTHHHLQSLIKTGFSERHISRLAEEAAYDELANSVKTQPDLDQLALHASFRSGDRTSMSHALMGNRLVKKGDNIVSYCQGINAGYITELERTMFVGEPNLIQEEIFGLVRRAQILAFDLIKPGVQCSQIDSDIRKFFTGERKMTYVQHHQGHGLGLEFHEAPFLDVGDQTILEPGMVLSVEPGLYLRNIGGFRHSDTVLVTDEGCEILTPYPSEIEELIIEPM